MTSTTNGVILDSALLHSVLYYSEDSPSKLRWKVYCGSRATKDSVAGSQRKDGYWLIRVKGHLLLVHRVIWCLHTDSIDPTLVINHIDNDPSNNNISNLEICTREHNSNNTKMHTGKGLRSDNTSGISGVSEMSSGSNLYVKVVYRKEGILTKKYFSYSKLGKEKAWEQAIDFKLACTN